MLDKEDQEMDIEPNVAGNTYFQPKPDYGAFNYSKVLKMLKSH